MTKKPTYSWKLSVPTINREEDISITNYPLKEHEPVRILSFGEMIIQNKALLKKVLEYSDDEGDYDNE